MILAAVASRHATGIDCISARRYISSVAGGVGDMPFFVRNCVRCGVKSSQHHVVGAGRIDEYMQWEIAGQCSVCRGLSVYYWHTQNSGHEPSTFGHGTIETPKTSLAKDPQHVATTPIVVSAHIPPRIADLFREANECRQMTWYEAAGAMYRKTLDVATKHIYSQDTRLAGKEPAQALRVRIKSLGEMKILEPEIVELADVAALDGNDATHDVDPYTSEEAEALEDLTQDLLDRLFVRPARLAAVKAKQIASGQRKPD